MKRRILPLAFAASVAALAAAAPALAAVHSGYVAATDACAGCHVAHAARAPKLLRAGPTQTELCFSCHGAGAPGAPYDVEYGLIIGSSGTYASTAGGFVKQGGAAGRDVTSRHSVWGYVYDANGSAGSWAGETAKSGLDYVPGGSQALTGSGLVCGSCHNPHGSANPRLLKTSILGASNLAVQFAMSDVGNGARVVTAYVDGSSRWCGSCHDRFKTLNRDGAPGEGHANYYLGMWRHPMDAHITPPPGFDGSLATGTPPEKGGSGIRHVACLTCHRAHSTTAVATGYALGWPRDPVAPGTGTSSALLRMDNRGVCYNCHGAGEYNSWNDTRLNCSDCHYQGASQHGSTSAPCSTCHEF